MTETALDFDRLFSRRVRAIDASGIRRIFELGARLENPINLSIGQPDFPVPDAMKAATIDAIHADRNGYTLTQGTPELLRAIAAHLRTDVGWDTSRDELGVMVTSGTSGALMLAFMAMLDEGDEAIIADPYFVIYPVLGPLSGGTIVPCDTYPDFRMTAARVEPLITDRTRCVLVNSPGNPSGAVLSDAEMRDLVDLCTSRGILLISDEIYDEFTYAEARGASGRCPSPARASDQVLLIRGFGKTYGCTGWRLGYAAGPQALITQMMKLQQYTFVCAPSMAQAGAAAAFGVDMSAQIDAYARRRDLVVEAFRGVTNMVTPGGAFYGFFEVPERLGLTASAFVERAIERRVLVIPGSAFSRRDTHVRLSFATSEKTLRAGLEVLVELLRG
ncbi:MAG: aminotransferase class I/II-fold pyridoxal phosphate-dependent enzyme [Phycisphaerales bacterium]|nr:aminotransferase class I/II-fold pyridoxal phosphate-dependent enzyme [Phycisphaerales bacterium]